MTLPDDGSEITPIEELFTYHIFGLPDRLPQWQKAIDAYTLTVSGMVDRPLELSLAQIQSTFEPVSDTMVLQCMTRVHWGRVQFRGARLLDVMVHAGLSDEAYKAALHGADGFDTDLHVREVRERPDAFLLAYAMNDQPLTGDHGFPIRMTAKGKYGYKWCKWLAEIRLVEHDYKGHYEGVRGWSDRAVRGRPVR